MKRPTLHPARHFGVTLLSAITWLLIPKCPMCLAAYIFAFTGASLTFITSSLTHKLLLIVVAIIFLYNIFQFFVHLRDGKSTRVS